MKPSQEAIPTSVVEESAGGRSRLARFFAVERPRFQVLAFSISFLGILVFADWVTGPDLHFGLLYSVPALFTTWFHGRRLGYLMSLFVVLTWLWADLHGASLYVHPTMAFGNSAIRVICIAAAVEGLASLRALSTRLESMVEERTRAVRQLAAELSGAEDLERRRIALDIHDGIGQVLSVLKLNLAAALSTQTEGSGTWHRIQDAITSVDELIQRSRSLTFDLHPSMLDHFGLVPTLQQYCEQFGRQTDIEVTVSEEGEPAALSAIAVNYLFRTVKELLSNAARHGKARQIVVSANWTPSLLRMVVDDDGVGFNPAAADSTSGLGLAGIRQRLLSFGGAFRLESGAGEGTRVVLEFPTASEEKAA